MQIHIPGHIGMTTIARWAHSQGCFLIFKPSGGYEMRPAVTDDEKKVIAEFQRQTTQATAR